jgi:hypothetical protein
VVNPAQPDTSEVSLWRRASTFERGIYSNLYRWLARKPDLGPPGAVAIGYVDLVRTTIYIWIGASALEMVAVHFLIGWVWLRWTLLIVSVWGLVWMFGYLAGLIVHPHLVEEQTVRIRNGHTIAVDVPVDVLASVSTSTRSTPGSRVVQTDEKDPLHLYIAVSGQVNVHLTLSEERTADLPGGRYRFTSVSFWADEPGAARRAIAALTIG